MDAIINGAQTAFTAGNEDSAVEVIRDGLGLTGTKLVCGTGVCGACTVLVDGVPTASCLLPASALAGRTVETIEAHAAGGRLHPVQKAFMAHDGLQCGFCTPGFINEAIAFYRSWRQQHGSRRPTREEVAPAMAGHLCRCGAYVGIYAAIQAACEGAFDGEAPAVAARIEAEAKVTGRARYTFDVKEEGQLEGLLLRSPHASARVVRLEANGVEAFVDLLSDDRTVRYAGQPIAAVAAPTRRLAEAALARVAVGYEVLPAVTSADAARRAGAALVYAETDRKDAPTAAEMPRMPARWEGNVRTSRIALASKKRKRARKLRDEAPPERRVAATFRTAAQSHSAFEPHVCVASWDSATRLVVHASTQACWSLGQEIAKHFGLTAEDVEVRCEHVGGGFGAKQSLTSETIAAIELSRAAGRPVRVALDRLEEMVDGGFRPGAEIEMALVADEQGALQAMCADIHSDGGTAIDSVLSMVMAQVYDAPHRSLIEHDVVSHLPPAKPFRGPGGPPAMWALEQAIDMMAEKLGHDPIELRRRWDPHEGRQRLYQHAAGLVAWRARQPAGAARGRFRRGVGVAIANWLNFYGKHARVEVTASSTGLSARSASQDIGTGARTVVASAVAEVFEVSPLEVEVSLGNSSAPRGISSGGSATTNALYAPALEAARAVRDKLAVAAKKRGTPGLSWRELLSDHEPVSADAVRGTDDGINLMSLLPIGTTGGTLGKGTSGAVYVVEVEVDTRLGRVRVPHVWAGIHAGKIVVPALARSQIHGGIIQGLGYALYEQRRVDPVTGHILTYNLEDYHVPGIGDLPEIVVFFDEQGFEFVKGGAVGLAELSTIPIAAAVGNAVYNATGWRPTELPLTPERVMAGVRS